MTAHLEAVRIARDHRTTSAGELQHTERAYRQAILRASEHHSLREIGRAAGVSHVRIKNILDQERGTT